MARCRIDYLPVVRGTSSRLDARNRGGATTPFPVVEARPLDDLAYPRGCDVGRKSGFTRGLLDLPAASVFVWDYVRHDSQPTRPCMARGMSERSNACKDISSHVEYQRPTINPDEATRRKLPSQDGGLLRFVTADATTPEGQRPWNSDRVATPKRTAGVQLTVTKPGTSKSLWRPARYSTCTSGGSAGIRCSGC